MISHRYRCIFVHIQRTAGSSIEQWICGTDWWRIDPATKHVLASQAKELYRPYWDDYFKFSFVRDPVSRILSCMHHSEHFGLRITKGNKIDFDGYHRRFGCNVILEHDFRFYRRSELIRQQHVADSIYGNIIDEPLDFVGKYETLYSDIEYIRNTLGIEKDFDNHLERSDPNLHPKQTALETIEYIRNICRSDMLRYDYEGFCMEQTERPHRATPRHADAGGRFM